MKKRYGISLEHEDLKQLDVIAVLDERSRSYLIRKAIRQFIEREGDQNARNN